MSEQPTHTTTAKELKIIVLSDGTGETAAQITKAAMLQFSDKDIYFTRYKNIRTKAQVEAIYDHAPDAITLNSNVFVGNYKFSLQGFTNKGPPTFSC